MNPKTRTIVLAALSKDIRRAKENLQGTIDSNHLEQSSRWLDLLKGLTAAYDDINAPDAWSEPVKLTSLSVGSDRLSGEVSETTFGFSGRLGSKGKITLRGAPTKDSPFNDISEPHQREFLLTLTKV